jgi:hypothetical protein
MYLITFIIWAPVAAFFSIGEQGFDMARFLFIMALSIGMHLAINFFNNKSTAKPNNFYYRRRHEPVEYIGLTPEIKRAVNYIRRENAPIFNSYSDSQIINYISLPAIMRLADQLNNEDSEQNQKSEYVYIPDDYILTNIKGFKNIEVYNNRKNYLIKPLKQPFENSLCSTNRPTIINKDTIISNLHLHYLLTVIDTAIGE